MRRLNRIQRRSRGGFTLVELLAVLAIIGILAAIVVPQVTRYMYNARVTRAVSEVKNAETALTGVLSETGRSGFRDMLTTTRRQTIDQWSAAIAGPDPGLGLQALSDAEDFYTQFFYELLRQGRDSEFIKQNVDAEVRQKLGTFYMDLGRDPWGQQYRFWMGPIRGPVILRSYRVNAATYNQTNDGFNDFPLEPNDPEFSTNDAYIYAAPAFSHASSQVPGQPRADDATIQSQFGGIFPNIRAYGYPAPDELPVYIWSSGPNSQSDANLLTQFRFGREDEFPDFIGGGDDPNSWDNEQGWSSAPRS